MAATVAEALQERWEVYHMYLRDEFWRATRVNSNEYRLSVLLGSQRALAEAVKFCKSFLRDADALEVPAHIREELQRILEAAPAARTRVDQYITRRRTYTKARWGLKPTKELLRVRKRAANLRQRFPRPTHTQASMIFRVESEASAIEDELWAQAVDEEVREDAVNRPPR
jgi:hypothetical protein